MNLPVFLSAPKAFNSEQQRFIDALESHLRERGLEPRTLGVNEYDNEIPLRTVRRLLLESNGVLAIGLRRYWMKEGAAKPDSGDATRMDGHWFTSPWPHIESAMGYQLGLPILVLRESGVHADGVLEKGTIDVYVNEIDVTQGGEFLASRAWKGAVSAWERDVRTVAKNRGMPPKLF